MPSISEIWDEIQRRRDANTPQGMTAADSMRFSADGAPAPQPAPHMAGMTAADSMRFPDTPAPAPPPPAPARPAAAPSRIVPPDELHRMQFRSQMREQAALAEKQRRIDEMLATMDDPTKQALGGFLTQTAEEHRRRQAMAFAGLDPGAEPTMPTMPAGLPMTS
jgi:hypothetical protein